MSGPSPAQRDERDAGDADFDHAPCGYLVTGPDGVVTRANAEVARLLGLEVTDVVGRRLASFLTGGGRIYLETHLLRVLEHDGVLREVDLDLVAADGTRTPVLLHASWSGEGAAMRATVFATPERHRYEHDLREATRRAESATRVSAALAQTLQQSLIPPLPPAVPFLEVAAAYRPAGDGTTVGGDFYDIFQTAPECWMVVLGDVSGKGVEAAAVTSLVRHSIRALAMQHADPREVLVALDRLVHLHETDHYCTVVLARLCLAEGTVSLDLCLAGHPPALVRHADGTVTELGVYGTPVGLVDSVRFETASLELSDEVVVLYTDGVTEARGEQGLFGESRLHRLLADAPHAPALAVDAVVDTVLDFQLGQTSDDIAVVSFAGRAPTTTPHA